MTAPIVTTFSTARRAFHAYCYGCDPRGLVVAIGRDLDQVAGDAAEHVDLHGTVPVSCTGCGWHAASSSQRWAAALRGRHLRNCPAARAPHLRTVDLIEDTLHLLAGGETDRDVIAKRCGTTRPAWERAMHRAKAAGDTDAARILDRTRPEHWRLR